MICFPNQILNNKSNTIIASYEVIFGFKGHLSWIKGQYIGRTRANQSYEQRTFDEMASLSGTCIHLFFIFEGFVGGKPQKNGIHHSMFGTIKLWYI